MSEPRQTHFLFFLSFGLTFSPPAYILFAWSR